jgi:hypothetical protein
MAAALTLIQTLLAVLQACTPLFLMLGAGFYGQQQRAAGAQSQALAANQVALKAETAIAAAEAAAPTTRLALVDRLKQGTA